MGLVNGCDQFDPERQEDMGRLAKLFPRQDSAGKSSMSHSLEHGVSSSQTHPKSKSSCESPLVPLSSGKFRVLGSTVLSLCI
jgi:hypothetical protein